MRPKLLICEPEDFSPRALRVLEGVFDVELGPVTRQELIRRADRYEALFVRLQHRIDAEVAGSQSAIRYIASPTTGLNHIDMDHAVKSGISVISLRGERDFLNSIHATPEHTWALLLGLIRRLPAAMQSVLSGRWDRDSFKGGELHGRSLGIIGYGRVGSKIASYAQAFGMNVLACDPHVTLPGDVVSVSLDDVFARADVICLLAAYAPETHHLVRAEHFARCKPGALFINTSRGELVDESALFAALMQRQIAGAALDVLAGENMDGGVFVGSPALIAYAREHDNLLLTPHIAGATHESMTRTEEFIASKLVAAVKAARSEV